MKFGVKVQAARTWESVKRHDVYSCPDTPDYSFVMGAQALELKSKKLNESLLRFVHAEISLTVDRPELKLVPIGLQGRLLAYIADAGKIPRILDNERHRFYFLWPDFIQKYAKRGQLETLASLALWAEKDRWFRWAKEATVLQKGWTRHKDGNKKDCYHFSTELKRKLAQNNLKPDGRNNGPAILAFRMAGGERPPFNSEGWPIHHIYDGCARIPNTQKTFLHAVQHKNHFTHSGGLVAAHPAAHFVAHHSELLSWLLRWEAFCRFDYDPDGIFKNAA